MGKIIGVCWGYWTSCLRSKEVEHLTILWGEIRSWIPLNAIIGITPSIVQSDDGPRLSLRNARFSTASHILSIDGEVSLSPAIMSKKTSHGSIFSSRIRHRPRTKGLRYLYLFSTQTSPIRVPFQLYVIFLQYLQAIYKAGLEPVASENIVESWAQGVRATRKCNFRCKRTQRRTQSDNYCVRRCHDVYLKSLHASWS